MHVMQGLAVELHWMDGCNVAEVGRPMVVLRDPDLIESPRTIHSYLKHLIIDFTLILKSLAQIVSFTSHQNNFTQS